MNKEQLMLPRWKVIADYPGSQYIIGAIKNWPTPISMDDYPHIFKRLEWWEETDIKEMPQHVSVDGMVKRVEGWRGNKVSLYDNPGEIEYIEEIHAERDGKGTELFDISVLLPATKEDYDNYINSKK